MRRHLLPVQPFVVVLFGLFIFVGAPAESRAAHHAAVAAAPTRPAGATEHSLRAARRRYPKIRAEAATSVFDDGQSEVRYLWAMRVLCGLSILLSLLFLKKSKSWAVVVPELALVAIFLYFASVVLRPI